MAQTMKDLPGSEQPYERFERYGPEFLTDAELLAIILRNGTKNKSAIDLAIEVLKQGQGNILSICQLSFEDLQRINGIGLVKAIQLKSVAELAKRISQTRTRSQIRLHNVQEIATYYMEELRHKKEEHLLALFFDAKCALLGQATLSIGGSNFAHLSPHEVLKEAMKRNAIYFVLLHNHPSGDPNPSNDDILITNRISDAGELMGISLQDHIVIGDLIYFSFRQNHLI